MKGTPAEESAREDRIGRERALALRLRDHRRQAHAHLQPPREQLDTCQAVGRQRAESRSRCCSRRMRLRDAHSVLRLGRRRAHSRGHRSRCVSSACRCSTRSAACSRRRSSRRSRFRRGTTRRWTAMRCARRTSRARARSAPVTLTVLETVAAGAFPSRAVAVGKLHAHHDRRAASRGRRHRDPRRGHRRRHRARRDSRRSRRAAATCAAAARTSRRRARARSRAADRRRADRRARVGRRVVGRRVSAAARRRSSGRATRSSTSIASPRRSTERRS